MFLFNPIAYVSNPELGHPSAVTLAERPYHPIVVTNILSNFQRVDRYRARRTFKPLIEHGITTSIYPFGIRNLRVSVPFSRLAVQETKKGISLIRTDEK